MSPALQKKDGMSLVEPVHDQKPMITPQQSMQDNPTPVIGCIDLGTNSVRLLIARIHKNHTFTILRREKHTIRLGEGEFCDKKIHSLPIKRAVLVCRRYAELCAQYHAADIIAVATSAIRDAVNRDDVIANLKQETEILFTIISGEEEARLIWRGISAGTEIGEDKTLIIDIGGGSTEIVVGDQDQYWMLKSLKMGAVRTTSQFFPDGFADAVNEETIEKILQRIRENTSHAVREVKKHGPVCAIGSSGTILTLESVAGKVPELALHHRPGILTRKEIRTLITMLAGLPLEDRRKVPGLSADRADIIIAGAVILYTILKETGIKEIRISEMSLRDGLLIDYLSNIPGFPYYEDIPVRWRSVHHLAECCQIQTEHAEQVQRLTLELFDSGRDAGLHRLDDSFRQLLAYAAYLHDIGQFIAFSGHQNHTYYLITNTPLLGFNRQEIEIMAQVAGSHRKKLKNCSDEVKNTPDASIRFAIPVMAMFLRIAEDLDRSYDSRVVQAVFTGVDENTATLQLTCIRDCTLEQWALSDEEKGFEKIFGLTLLTRWTDLP